jgi:hypothetical protein
MPDFKGARQGSRIERGYGRGHVAMRRALLARHHPADPCCLCGRPLGPAGRSIHLDHCPTCKGAGCPACKGAGYRGLSHARCNVVDGARRGQQRSRATRLRW